MARIVNKFCPDCGKKFMSTDEYKYPVCMVCVGKEKDKIISDLLKELRENKTLEERIEFLEEKFCLSEYYKRHSRHNISTRII